MTALPQSVKDIDLLRWVAAHPSEAFDPGMVVTVTHATDWQWQAVVNQMEVLARQTYIRKIKGDPTGATYWTITPKGENYLRALERAEKADQEVSVGDLLEAPNPAASPPSTRTTGVDPPRIAKAFEGPSIALNATTRLTFTITNPNPKDDLTEIGFTDVLPAGLVVSTPSGLVGSWAEGQLLVPEGGDRISLSGARLPPSGSCTFQLIVTGAREGPKNNVTSNVTSREGGNGGAATASLEVVGAPASLEVVAAPPPDRRPSLRMLADVPLASDSDDRLDFKPYADALAGLIDSPNTTTPLTLEPIAKPSARRS
jgi:hypothetical protein